MKKEITVLGAGSWGTTLSLILSKKDNLSVRLWSPFKEQIQSIKKNKENKDFLPGFEIPKKIGLTHDLGAALSSPIIVSAIPVKYLRQILRKVSLYKEQIKDSIFLSVSKGMDIDTFQTPTCMIQEELGINKVAVLSGPTIAKEVVKGIPTVATIAAGEDTVLNKLEKIFKSTNLRVYKSKDLRGVELAGGLKNVIAIGCGISDGLNFGTNTKSALVTRGLVEMSRFGVKLGARAETFWGVSGLGDLATTCFSFNSRNRFVGQEVGKGKKIKDVLKKMKMVAEGVHTVKAVYKANKKYKVDIPITEQVYKVLYKNKGPLKAVEDLMNRPFKAE